MTYFFIHTPKTSGTTFMNVLQKDKTNCVGSFYPLMGEMDDFKKIFEDGPRYHFEKNPDWKKYNIIGGHFTFGIHKIFKTEHFRYIGVFRNPVEHYISMYKAYLRLPEVYLNKILPGVEKSLENLMKLEITHNMQTWFLTGISPSDISSDKELAYQTAIENCEKYFDGIYPTERFDEGLFFFKHKTGLKPQFYSRINVAKNNISEQNNSDQLNEIRKINDVDIRLYNYLNDKFDKDFNKFSGIRNEVRIFKFLNSVNALKNRITKNN